MADHTDYTHAPYFALSAIGYGKGFTAQEAEDNYVASQLLNIPARNTIYETPARWKKALRTGEAQASVWKAPEGTWGHVQGWDGLTWLSGDENHPTKTKATADQLVKEGWNSAKQED